LIVSNLAMAQSAGAWTGTLDLSANDMVIHGGSLSTIASQIQAGYDGGDWLGSGITSSAAANNTSHLTALGVIQNSVDGSLTGAALYSNAPNSQGPFDGMSLANADVLLKYTYIGDANLDGKIDGSDYSRIDDGYTSQSTGWFNGDFNYDRAIDGSDYTLIDNAFNNQGAALAASPTALIATPSSARSSLVPLLAVSNHADIAASKARNQSPAPTFATGSFQIQMPVALAEPAVESLELSMRKTDLVDALSALNHLDLPGI
jgi:hypothetical protein